MFPCFNQSAGPSNINKQEEEDGYRLINLPENTYLSNSNDKVEARINLINFCFLHLGEEVDGERD